MDAKEAYARRAEVEFLDVREPREWRTGHIDGSRHLPMGHVLRHLGELDKSRPIIAVCRSGNRSGMIARLLQAQGFSAENLDGGLKQWVKAGLPLVSADSSDSAT